MKDRKIKTYKAHKRHKKAIIISLAVGSLVIIGVTIPCVLIAPFLKTNTYDYLQYGADKKANKKWVHPTKNQLIDAFLYTYMKECINDFGNTKSNYSLYYNVYHTKFIGNFKNTEHDYSFRIECSTSNFRTTGDSHPYLNFNTKPSNFTLQVPESETDPYTWKCLNLPPLLLPVFDENNKLVWPAQ